MKSKRSPLLVITDNFVPVDMHFCSDGTKGVIIQCKTSDILKLAKEASRKIKHSNKKLTKVGRFIHLSPEISFFIKP